VELKLCFVALVALFAGACDRATTGSRIPVYDRPQVALVVIDAQRDFLESSGHLPSEASQVEPMLAAVNRLIEGTPGVGVEVVYVRSTFSRDARLANWLRNGAAVEGSPGADFDARLAGSREPVFAKRRSDAFSNADLDRYFRSRGIDHLVLAGARADSSVYFTALGAMNRGYKVKVVTDAVAAQSDRRRDAALDGLVRRGAEIANSEITLREWLRRKRYLASH